jgi:hypothetical protein
MPLPRVSWAPLGVALFSFAVWNGIFDFLVSRGERDYFWAQARHAAGQGPPVVLHDMMAESIAYARLVATWWAAVTLAAGLLLIWYVRRTTLRERG